MKEKQPKSPAVLYDFAESVKTVAEVLISKHHSELGSARFLYIFRSKASKKGGIPVPGKVRKLGGWTQFALESDFMMEIGLDMWNNMHANQRSALIDHLLSHCVGEEDERTGDMKWKTRPPEVQEFPEVAERHGAWNNPLIDIQKVLKDK
jgi:hypothetical protein